MTSALKASFPPTVDASVRLLVLGSLPGEASLAANQYYANPSNHFWRLIGGVIGVDLRALAYPDRLRRLLAAGVGLWDVIASARRAGSLDGAIVDHTPNDLAALVMRLPALRTIGFNGAKAAAIGRRQLAGAGPATLVDLPSSSAAYCTISFDTKQARWLVLRDAIQEAA